MHLLTLHFLTRVPMSARSLRTMKSNLKRCVTKGLHRPWLSEADDVRVSDAIGGMIELSVPSIRQALAFRDCMVQRVRVQSGGLVSRFDLQWMACTQHSRDSMMRAQDRFGGKSRKCDVEWKSGGHAVAWVQPGKCHKDRQPTALYFDAGNFSSSAFCLRQYWNSVDMDSRADSAFLYPFIDPVTDAIDWSRPMTNSNFLADTHRRAHLAGMPEHMVRKLTGHSHRSGGCTDRVMAGVPGIWIKMQGRWKSDAFMTYFRLSQFSMHYVASEMFSRVCRLATG
jgi:hypothetical protein